MINTRETISIAYEKITYDRNNCVIHTISSVAMCLFLIIGISINCYFYNLRNEKYYLIISVMKTIMFYPAKTFVVLGFLVNLVIEYY